MLALIPLLIVIALVVAAFMMVRMARDRRRERLRAEPFPEPWREILQRAFALYSRLPESLRTQLEDDIQIFVDEKRFVGCKGLEMTDEVRVVIAAQACLLTLNQAKRYYPKLLSIYVYPSTFVAQREEVGPDGVVTAGGEVNLGESWDDGRVVLAWDASRNGAINMDDGRNVVYHEFAHQLDQADGSTDGVPELPSPGAYATWIDTLGREYKLLRARQLHVVDSYGATDGAEFFASATEAFFEKPKLLAMRHQALFEALRDYYQLDPREWG